MPKRIAILGAGASGLTAIKCCLDEGLTPVCFERSDHMGGLWYYTEKVKDGQSCVMKSTVINTSKEVMSYSDFLIPAHFPVFMHNTKVNEYLQMYARSFDAKKYIQFHTEVMKVNQTGDFDKTGQWELQITDHASQQTRTEVFDGVMVCTGHHADKNIPNIEGLDKFKGRVVHTHDYRDHVGYEGKRVVVIGIGNSGGDVAVELSRIARQVFLSTRRGTWVINRISDSGYPADMLIIRRVMETIRSLLPRNVFNSIAESKVNSRFDHANYGLKPKHRFDAQHPMVNDELPNRIACGTVIVKPDIKRFTETGVEFVDGSKEEIDEVILGTGFIFGFPFVEHPALEVKKNTIDLYKFVFPPDIRPATLAVIGFIQPVGAIMPISEIQCRWAARIFSGAASVPSKEVMMSDIRAKQTAMRERYVDSQRHTIQTDYLEIMDEIAEHIGCKPDIGSLLWSDPRLALSLYFGSFCPYQYRLMGPGRWEGARYAVMTVWDRTLAGTRPPGPAPSQGTSKLLYIVAFVVLAVFVKFVLGLIL